MEDQSEQEKASRNESTTEQPKFNSALSGILGNALNSSLKHQTHGAGLETKRCPNCSAARPAETDLQYCAYCGYQFY